MHKNPIIVTGSVDSGKTSMLYSLCSRLDLAGCTFGGMIQVPSIPGSPKRDWIWSDQGTGETRLLMSLDEAPGIVRSGSFWVAVGTFPWAHERLRARLSRADYLTFDEIGPLELAGRALDSTIRKVLQSYQGTVIAVIRRPLLEQVCMRYGMPIDHAHILYADQEWDAQLECVLS